MEVSNELLVLPPPLPEQEQKPEIASSLEDTPMELVDEVIAAADKQGLIKVTNISPGASKEQMKTLFGFLGKIEELALYPMDDNVPVASKICYVKYEDKASCDVAQHLTNTVFIDRPLVIIPISEAEIPDEGTALQPKGQNNGFGNGDFQDPFSADPFAQFMGSFDMGSNLPPPPVLGNIDPVKIEEIRRTIFVSSLDDSVSPEMLVAFFSGVGEIKYVRQLQEEDGTNKRALIEFTDLSAVATALQYTGVIFCGKPLKVNYSKCAIIKPDFEKLEAERKYADRISRYSSRRRSSSLNRRRSKSKSRSRSRDRRSSRRSSSRSYSRSRRARSGSRSRKRRSRSRSYTRQTRRRSKSGSRSRRRRRSRTRSRSKEGNTKKMALPSTKVWDRRRRRSYSRSRSRDSKYRSSSSRHHTSSKSRRRSKSRSVSRSGSADKKSKSKSPAKDEEKIKKARSRSRSRSQSKSHSRRKSKKERRSRSRTPSRSRSRDRKTREKDRKRDRKERERSNSKTKKTESPKKRGSSPQYKDGEGNGNRSEMSMDDEDSISSKKKSKSRCYDSAEESPARSKKKSRSGRREDSD